MKSAKRSDRASNNSMQQTALRAAADAERYTNMKRAFALAAAVALVMAAQSLAASAPGIQVSVYPYFHGEETAWRVHLHPSGHVLVLRSTVPVKLASFAEARSVIWREERRFKIEVRDFDSLVAALRSLELDSLEDEYSANFSSIPEDAGKQTVHPDGSITTIGLETHHIVTHGPKYQLELRLGDLEVETFVYQPMAALEWDSPAHPARDEILKFVEALKSILRASGPAGMLDSDAFEPLDVE